MNDDKWWWRNEVDARGTTFTAASYIQCQCVFCFDWDKLEKKPCRRTVFPFKSDAIAVFRRKKTDYWWDHIFERTERKPDVKNRCLWHFNAMVLICSWSVALMKVSNSKPKFGWNKHVCCLESTAVHLPPCWMITHHVKSMYFLHQLFTVNSFESRANIILIIFQKEPLGNMLETSGFFPKS